MESQEQETKIEKCKLGDFSSIAKLVKSNETYDIHDYEMEHLVISTTKLHPGKETRGHTHPGDQEEVYICLEGSGKIQIDEETTQFSKNDMLFIKQGQFHKVINDSEGAMLFMCVFEKYERE